MTFETSFSGRIVQIIEALDYGDAVSNQVIAIDRILKELGFDSLIVAQWKHPTVEGRCKHLNDIQLNESDIAIYHFVGHAEYSFEYATKNKSSKILLYHNITPHHFFRKQSNLYDFCLRGREQLKNIIPYFNHYWGDSEYNIRELIKNGANPQNCRVIPILVEGRNQSKSPDKTEPGSWLFVGRIAANKGQIALLKMFLKTHKENPKIASHLYLVGGFDTRDDYYLSLENEVKRNSASEIVTITGKISDTSKEAYFQKACVYVSLSEHEGFGVPLIEAPLRGVPVIALDNTAVGETMGFSKGLAASPAGLPGLIEAVVADRQNRSALLTEQKNNAKRFNRHAVRNRIISALKEIIPSPHHYKTVSVVICTYNRRNFLQRCLDYLSFQNMYNFEVIVVDGPSCDGTKELLKAWNSRIKIAHNPNRNLSQSRNIGADLADGDIVAYIDDDAIPFADWVDTILREFNRRPLTTAALGGPAYYAGTLKFQAEDIGFNHLAEAKMNIVSEEIGSNGWVRSLLGTNTAFTRHHLEEAGGFDEQYDYFLDESDLTFRLQRSGYTVSYCPDLYLRHEFARSENRTGKYSYNWHSICKNTAYFVATYSGLTAKEAKSYLVDRLARERIEPLVHAVKAGEITTTQEREYTKQIWAGLEQGLKDAKHAPRTRSINARPNAFLPFQLDDTHRRVNIDVKRLHICLITKEFPPFGASGGIGTLYYHLASELLLLGHEVTVILPSEDDKTYTQGRFRIRFVRQSPVPLGDPGPEVADNISWALRALNAAAEVHNRHPIDIFDSALWDTEALAVAMLDRTKRPPLVVRLVTPFAMAAKTNEWSVPEIVAEQYMTAEKELIAHADAIVPISHSISSTISELYDVKADGRWSVSHCGIAYWPFFDVNSGYGEFGELDGVSDFLRPDVKLVLFVGRLEKRKGIDLLLQAINLVLSKQDDTCLVVAGHDVEGWQEKSKEYLDDKLRGRVRFLGSVPDSTREKLLSRAYCLVFPSRYESFGLVPLEAYVHGVPVIASNAGAIPEVVHDGVSGLLFDPNNFEELADKICLLIKDTDLREKLSQGAQSLSRIFSGRSAATRAIDLYASLAN